MSFKQILVIVLALALVGGIIYLIFGRDKKQVEPVNTAVITPTPTPKPVNLVTWTDEAGFSFKYPEGTQIDKHPEDKENYANLTLTLPSKEIVNIIMADNKYKTLDKWVGEKSALDTTLEGRPAKRIIEGDSETIACIDNEVLVTISGKELAGIIDSWTFIYPTPAATKKTAAPAAEDPDVLEEI